MTAKHAYTPVEKIATGISSFDIIAKGGLPRNRTTLISGTAGSGKTIFAVQFLAAGIEAGIPGVFVTFEEAASDIRKNMLSFGWDLGTWEAEGKLAFVDASPDTSIDTIEAGAFDPGAPLARGEPPGRQGKAERGGGDFLGAGFFPVSHPALRWSRPVR